MAQGTRRGFVRYWLPVLAYVALIFSVSSIPSLQPPLKFVNSDKVMHMTEYSVLGYLLVRALRTVPPWRTLLAAGLVTLAVGMTVGALDEVYQRGVPNRESSPLDWIADTLGLTLGVTAYTWFKRPRAATAASRRGEA